MIDMQWIFQYGVYILEFFLDVSKSAGFFGKLHGIIKFYIILLLLLLSFKKLNSHNNIIFVPLKNL